MNRKANTISAWPKSTENLKRGTRRLISPIRRKSVASVPTSADSFLYCPIQEGRIGERDVEKYDRAGESRKKAGKIGKNACKLLGSQFSRDSATPKIEEHGCESRRGGA